MTTSLTLQAPVAPRLLAAPIMSDSTFSRRHAIETIFAFAGHESADPVRFQEWLNGLTNEQLQSFLSSLEDEAAVAERNVTTCEASSPARQLLLMPSRGVCQTEHHRVHAVRADGTPLCGGGHKAKSAPSWQMDIGPVNCEACLTIKARRVQ